MCVCVCVFCIFCIFAYSAYFAYSDIAPKSNMTNTKKNQVT